MGEGADDGMVERGEEVRGKYWMLTTGMMWMPTRSAPAVMEDPHLNGDSGSVKATVLICRWDTSSHDKEFCCGTKVLSKLLRLNDHARFCRRSPSLISEQYSKQIFQTC